MTRPIGIYEKATPKHFTWKERLEFAKELGFDFVEMSVDESDARLARLEWSKEERFEVVKAVYETGVRIPTICFSGHRRYPLGSNNPALEAKSLETMKQCIELAQDLGVRVIQLAGYDVYYEEKSPETRARFLKNLRKACNWAEQAQVILAIEIMDDPFINSIEKYLAVERLSTRLISLSIQTQVISQLGTMTSIVSLLSGTRPWRLCISRIPIL